MSPQNTSNSRQKKSSTIPKSKWRFSKPKQDCGILVFIDAELEHLLPWWWYNYQLRSSYPVTFIDFGMSSKALTFCQERGDVQPMNFDHNYFQIKKEDLPEKKQKLWGSLYGKYLWGCHSKWMLKPFALQITPYQTTLFLDIDTQVLGSLNYLFENFSHFSCAKEPQSRQDQHKEILLPGEHVYNSGVIIYAHRCKIIELFTEKTLNEHLDFPTDQNVLSRVILQSGLPFCELPTKYNGIASDWIPRNCSILHWCGKSGKKAIESMSSILFYGKDPFTNQPLKED